MEKSQEISPQGKEQVSSTVTVRRFARQETQESQESEEETGFRLFNELNSRLTRTYPDRNWISEDILAGLNPDEVHASFGASVATYLALKDNQVVGGFIGKDAGDHKFLGSWFVVDPKDQDGLVATSILDSIKQDFSSISLSAMSFGGKKDTIDELSRDKALVRYYQRHGFVIDPRAKLTSPLSSSNFPVPMIWERNAPQVSPVLEVEKQNGEDVF